MSRATAKRAVYVGRKRAPAKRCKVGAGGDLVVAVSRSRRATASPSKLDRDDDQQTADTHVSSGASRSIKPKGRARSDQKGNAAQMCAASPDSPDMAGAGDHDPTANHAQPEPSPAAHTFVRLVEAHQDREDVIRAGLRLLLQMKAICRRLCSKQWQGGTEKQYTRHRKKVLADAEVLYAAATKPLGKKQHPLAGIAAIKITHLFKSYCVLEQARKGCEAHLLAVAHLVIPQHVQEWAASVRGLGDPKERSSLAQIVASAGYPLDNYANPARLWKRMGLGIVQGSIQKLSTDKKLARAFGYNPKRRALMHVIGENQVKSRGAYYAAYVERKAYEHTRNPEMSDGHADRRAKRYIEKRLLTDLWRVWNRKL